MIDRAIILPYGEEFSENSAGAAGIFVKESLQNNKIKKKKPKKTILTNLHSDIDYSACKKKINKISKNIFIAYDGLKLIID